MSILTATDNPVDPLRGRTGSNEDVARMWGDGRRDYGRANSMSFRGGTVYSYSTAIARRVKSLTTGEVAYFITSIGYSQTTKTKHLPPVRRAVMGRGEVFYVDNVLADSREHHMANICEQENEIHAEIKRALRARKHKEVHAERVDVWIRQLLRYAEFLGLGFIDPNAPLAVVIDWFREVRGRELLADDAGKLFPAAISEVMP